MLSELGFHAELLPLDRDAVAALGLPADARAARITHAGGVLRAVALEVDGASSTRDIVVKAASSLARTASQLLWLLVVVRPSAPEVAIACWRSVSSRVKIVSLLCRPDRIVQSDAETLCTLAAVRVESDLLTHARWLDVLGREAITGRFFHALDRTVNEMAASLTGRGERNERRELALLYVSRLIFLSFLETKGWLNGDFSFLSNRYTRCLEAGGRFQRRVLEPLFFGTLNTAFRARSALARDFGRIPFLNGGLFSRSRLEKQRRASQFSDESFGNAFSSLLSRYRFTSREDTADWSEASIDPEILGKAFEALMASGERKRSGAFYTPQDLVESLSAHALDSVLRDAPATADALDALAGIRVLDPACGSGAFLVHLLERLASLRLGQGEQASLAEVRRRVLTTSIFGVDLNPMAVWLCQLRLWLSVVVEIDDDDPMRIAPLPNLDRHVRVGDSLAGGAFDDRGTTAASRKLAVLRARYTRASGSRKHSLARALDRMERSAAIDVLKRTSARLTADRKEMLVMIRGRDLFGLRTPPDPAMRVRLEGIRRGLRDTARRIRALQDGAGLPFSFSAYFSDIAAAGGFDLVIGNPPWVRVHRIAELSRQRLRQDFTVYRRAAWEAGAIGAGAGRGFAAQVDLAALFVERGCDLLRPGGTLAYLLPSKLWRSLAGGGVRELLLDHCDIVLIEDLTGAPNAFDAAVYPSLLVARLHARGEAPVDVSEDSAPQRDRITVTIRSGDAARSWRCAPRRLPVDGSIGSPWLLLPGTARRSFDRVTKAAAPLHISRFGRPMLGVKTGCNDAFLVRLECLDAETARIRAGERHGEIEREMLRPVLRGEAIAPWVAADRSEHIVWTHCGDGTSRRELPLLARRWLWHHRAALAARTDRHLRGRWWSLFRTESAAFDRHRVIWADFGLRPRAIVAAAGDPLVALNTCYVVRCRKMVDAQALAAILNGPLAAAWLNAIAEPARGGYRRYLGWTIAMLPIPDRWNRARRILAPLGERAIEGNPPSDEALLEASLDAYRLDRGEVEPLLSWNVRPH